jgi:Cu/Ag efflux pump CusA
VIGGLLYSLLLTLLFLPAAYTLAIREKKTDGAASNKQHN